MMPHFADSAAFLPPIPYHIADSDVFDGISEIASSMNMSDHHFRTVSKNIPSFGREIQNLLLDWMY